MTERNTHAEETQLADAYLDTAKLGQEVAAHALVQALKEAKAGTLRDPAKTATSAITASAIALDKRLVLQERPTQYIAVDPSAALNALARRVGVKYDAETTAVEIPATNEITSPSAESAAKTRASGYITREA
jgi:hypothetical protein